MWQNPSFPEDLVTFAEEIFNGKFCAVPRLMPNSNNLQNDKALSKQNLKWLRLEISLVRPFKNKNNYQNQIYILMISAVFYRYLYKKGSYR